MWYFHDYIKGCYVNILFIRSGSKKLFLYDQEQVTLANGFSAKYYF